MSEIRKRLESNSKTKNSISSDNKNTTVENRFHNKVLSLSVIPWVVVIISLLTVTCLSYFASKDNIRTFAKQTELLAGKGQIVECSPDYVTELHKYEGCVPRDCKRFVTDKVVSVREADELLNIAKRGLKYGGSLGGASILDLHSGALLKGKQFVDIYKVDEMKNVFNQSDFNILNFIIDKIKHRIAGNFDVRANNLYLTHPTFFSEMTPRQAVISHDAYWRPHIDKETYKSFHYTTLLYLGDYNIDFKGGRFVFIDKKYNTTIEPRKARLSMFTSGAENYHYVEKVTAGVRYAMTIPFTCDKNFALEELNAEKYNKT